MMLIKKSIALLPLILTQLVIGAPVTPTQKISSLDDAMRYAYENEPYALLRKQQAMCPQLSPSTILEPQLIREYRTLIKLPDYVIKTLHENKISPDKLKIFLETREQLERLGINL